MYISAIGYAHGEPSSIAELGDEDISALCRPEHGLANYRVSDQEIWQLALAACEQTLSSVVGAVPDLLVYVTENDRDVACSVRRLAEALAIPTLEYVVVSGHGCGNFGPALRVACDAICAGQRGQILVVLADRVSGGSRMMLSGLSVFSDGAASCVVSLEPTDARGPHFTLLATTTVNRAEVAPEAADASMLSIVSMASDGIIDLTRKTRIDPGDFDHVLFSNYRIISQKFLASAMGFPAEKLLIGQVGEFGHCFSADILVTLHMAASEGKIKPGDRVVASATGPYSWSMVAAERV